MNTWYPSSVTPTVTVHPTEQSIRYRTEVGTGRVTPKWETGRPSPGGHHRCWGTTTVRDPRNVPKPKTGETGLRMSFLVEVVIGIQFGNPDGTKGRSRYWFPLLRLYIFSENFQRYNKCLGLVSFLLKWNGRRR